MINLCIFLFLFSSSEKSLRFLKFNEDDKLIEFVLNGSHIREIFFFFPPYKLEVEIE